jgi:hypothetical protein
MTVRALVRCLAVVACALAFVGAPRAALANPHDLWYIVELAGKRAGYMHVTETNTGGLVVSRTETVLSIRRAANDTITIRMDTEFEETPEGKPVRATTVQEMGAAPITSTFTFLPDKIEKATSSGGGAPTVTTVPLSEGAWLTPGASGEYLRKRLEADAKEIVVRTLEPDMGLTPIVTTHKVLEKTTAEALGRTVPAIRVTSTVDRLPGVTSESFLDLTGEPIRTTMNLGGLPMTMIAADKDLALSKVDAPELMKSTLVKPDRPIARARTLRRGVFRLSVDKGELGPIYAGGVQAVEPLNEREAKVVVDLSRVEAVTVGAEERATALAPSMLVSCADVAVKELVDRVPKGEPPSPGARAEAMRRLVFAHIRKKDLGVGLGSAADTARTREGDCTEHAVLLCAMLRADGIPSRVVSGLVYVDSFAGAEGGIFGYHMWTQALMKDGAGERWVDLDPTLGPENVFDATHIALATSLLDDKDAMNSMVSLAGLLGRLKISVVEPAK